MAFKIVGSIEGAKKFLKEVKRVTQVTIAGFTIGVASVVAPLDFHAKENPIVEVDSVRTGSIMTPTPQVSISLNETTRRNLLEDSLKKYCHGNMSEYAISVWGNILEGAAKVPFENAAVIFQESADVFNITFFLPHDRTVTANIYIDDEEEMNPMAYFSVRSQSELFYQSMLPMSEFLIKTANIWTDADLA